MRSFQAILFAGHLEAAVFAIPLTHIAVCFLYKTLIRDLQSLNNSIKDCQERLQIVSWTLRRQWLKINDFHKLALYLPVNP